MRIFGRVVEGVTFFTAGIFDKITRRTCGVNLQIGKKVAYKLYGCEPWSDHFELHAIDEINTSLDQDEFSKARFFCDVGAKNGADPDCIEMAKLAIDVAEKGHTRQFSIKPDVFTAWEEFQYEK